MVSDVAFVSADVLFIALLTQMSTCTKSVADSVSKTSANHDGRFNLPLILTKTDVAAAVPCTTRHIDNLVARGLFHPIRLGRSVRFRRERFLADLAKLEGAAA